MSTPSAHERYLNEVAPDPVKCCAVFGVLCVQQKMCSCFYYGEPAPEGLLQQRAAHYRMIRPQRDRIRAARFGVEPRTGASQ